MTLPPPSADRTLNIYLLLAQYPILQTKIRARMRRELFNRGVITSQAFEAEVRKKSIEFVMKLKAVDAVTIGFKSPQEIDEAIENMNNGLAMRA